MKKIKLITLSLLLLCALIVSACSLAACKNEEETTVYTIEYDLDGGTGNENPTQYTAKDMFYLSGVKKEHYTFVGWMNETNTIVTAIMQGTTGNLKFTAKWKLTEYSISYNLDGGSATNVTSYTYESEDIIINNPTKLNYRFAGWTGTDLTEATKELTIASGSVGDREYTATWILCAIHAYNDEYTCHDRVCKYCGGAEIKATTEHEWNATTGKCNTCGEECEHDYKEGTCDVCGFVHAEHTYVDSYTCHDGWCTVCYAKLAATTEHDLDANCQCKNCQEYSHNYNDEGICTRCEYVRQYTRDGDYIYFGSYPQSEVTDNTLVTALNGIGETGTWVSYGYEGSGTAYMWYQDITYSTEKYRGVYFISYRSGNQLGNGYTTRTVYWFKYEPIKWRILEESNGYATILAELILDSQAYQNEYEYKNGNYYIKGTDTYANNYEYSSIRAWLNDTFYNTAFNELQKALIQTVEVDNSARSTNPDNNATYINGGKNSYACANTQDKVWLLSVQEVTRESYGFATSSSTGDTARCKQPTAYAQCQGAYNNNGKYGWWLRSPYYYCFGVMWVNHYQYGDQIWRTVKDTGIGVVPALKIRIS